MHNNFEPTIEHKTEIRQDLIRLSDYGRTSKGDYMNFLDKWNKIMGLNIVYDSAIPINLVRALDNCGHRIRTQNYCYEYNRMKGTSRLVNIDEEFMIRFNAVCAYRPDHLDIYYPEQIEVHAEVV